ncbi:hypothetical protein GIB67_011956 [Kingdonia uniflora]|uniref:Uncharacterized protein n=1 Tax=Kingdonia uniflora TaxID=39325 RepID=A0A7J7LZW3_9MAGN|nr:hypothetical protein GIB67_011956 [Kingdonia uniflora]
MELASTLTYTLGILDTIGDDSIDDILESWNSFCMYTNTLLNDKGDLSVGADFAFCVHVLCKYGLESLVYDHFMGALQETFERNGVSKFWRYFDDYKDVVSRKKMDESHNRDGWTQQLLCNALEEICSEKYYQEKCLLILVHALQSYHDSLSEEWRSTDVEKHRLLASYRLVVSSVLMASLPSHFHEILHLYFKERLEDLSTIVAREYEDASGPQVKNDMDLDERIDLATHRIKFSENHKLVKNIGKVVRDLRSLGFTSMTEDAYASAIFLLLKTKVHDLAGDDYRSSILESIKEWIHLPCNVYINSSREKNKVSKIFRNLTWNSGYSNGNRGSSPGNNNAGNYRNRSNNRNRNNNNRGSGHRSVDAGLPGAAPGPLWQQSTNGGHLNPNFAQLHQ